MDGVIIDTWEYETTYVDVMLAFCGGSVTSVHWYSGLYLVQ